MKQSLSQRLKMLLPFSQKGPDGASSLPGEQKQSQARRLIALTAAGRPQWSPRDVASLATEGYLKNAVAYRCIRMVAEAAATVNILVVENDKVVRGHPLCQILAQPNPESGGKAFREQVFSALQTTGNAYIEAGYDLDQNLSELWPLRSDRVTLIPDAQGWAASYEYRVGGQTVRIGRDDEGWLKLLHLKYYHPLDDWYGFSPLEAAAYSIDVHNASSAWNKALLDNAARPSGALVYGREGADRLSEDQFNRLKEQLSSLYSGADNAGRPLLLEGGLDWKPMALSPSEMDFINGKHAAARDIALSFGVPSQLLGIPGDNSYANYREANLAFWRQTVVPLAERFVEGLNGWLAPKFQGVSFMCDLDSLAALSSERESLWARLDAASFLSEAERRRLAGLAPLKDQEL